MEINNKYKIEDVVFLITDENQLPRIVTAIQISQYELIYKLVGGTSESWHYDYEIATNKNFLI